MAIKVNGTTVIDDSRNLVNIVSGAGSSTTYGDVGTYTWGRPDNHTNYEPGDTTSALVPLGAMSTSVPNRYAGSAYGFQNSEVHATASGTWRSMNGSHAEGTGDFAQSWSGLWVRIS
jgi:hypothetical protein